MTTLEHFDDLATICNRDTAHIKQVYDDDDVLTLFLPDVFRVSNSPNIIKQYLDIGGKLSLQVTCMDDFDASDVHIGIISKYHLRRFTELYFDYCDSFDAFITVLYSQGPPQNLKKLSLVSSDITDAVIPLFTHLEYLDVDDTLVTDISLLVLSGVHVMI